MSELPKHERERPVFTSEIRCPWCGAKQGEHADRDYATFFTIECSCGGISEVTVHAIPEFEAVKIRKDRILTAEDGDPYGT